MGRVGQLRGSISAGVDRAAATADAARQRSEVVDALFATRERDARAAGGVLAGAVAFRLFVYLLPLFLLLVSLLGVAAAAGSGADDAVSDRLGLSRYLIDSVDGAADQSR